jgi:hypothetical protein
MIATRHRRENEAAAKLYRSLGFVDWKITRTQGHPSGVYLWYPGLNSLLSVTRAQAS